MFEHLQTVLRDQGPLGLLPLAFVIGGAVALLVNGWGLLTGGPRALREPGTPYLYDRVYYLLMLAFLAGWLCAMVSGGTGMDGNDALFLLGWGLSAIGIGGLFALRGDMIMRGMIYRSKYGAWWRPHITEEQAARWQKMAWLRRAFGGLFMVIGTGALVVNLPRLPQALASLDTIWQSALALLG